MATTISGDNGLVAPVGAVYNGIQSQIAKTATGTSVDFTGIRITTVSGTATFNAGSTNILYE